MPPAITLKQDWDDYLFDALRLLDVALLCGVAIFAYALRFGTLDVPSAYWLLMFVGTGLVLACGQMLGLYKYHALRTFTNQVTVLSATFGLSMAILACLLVFTKLADDFSRIWVLIWFGVSFVLILTVHAGVQRWFSQQVGAGRFARKVVIWGISPRAELLVQTFTRDHLRNIRPVGVFVRPGETIPESLAHLPPFQDLSVLIDFCRQSRVDDVIVCEAVGDAKTTAVEALLDQLQHLPCHVRYCLPMPLFQRGNAGAVWGVPLHTIYQQPLTGRRQLTKRVFDLVISSVLFVLFFVPVYLVCLVYYRGLRGQSVFFKQYRTGMAGEEVLVWKFRTMSVSEDGKHQGMTQATQNDARVTPLGRFLRKTSLDEFAQLVNVFRGEMSFIGPRPHALSMDADYKKILHRYAARHRVKPGLTGWAQVNGWRGETDTLEKMEQRVAHDIYYIENWSLWLDCKILFLTFFVPFQKNAY